MNIYYLIQGIENGKFPFMCKCTFKDILNNTGEIAETETRNALYDYFAEYEFAELNKPIMMQGSRNNDLCQLLLTRVTESTYNKTNIVTIDRNED